MYECWKDGIHRGPHLLTVGGMVGKGGGNHQQTFLLEGEQESLLVQ